MSDRLVRTQLVRRHRARADRRAVLVSLTAAGRQVVDQATARRRVIVAGILAKLPAGEQQAVVAAFRSFAEAAGEIADSLWPPVPAPVPGGTESGHLRPSKARASTEGW